MPQRGAAFKSTRLTRTERQSVETPTGSREANTASKSSTATAEK
nr:MAG TPA: hypothetical protein [Caudoviricetes sp.]